MMISSTITMLGSSPSVNDHLELQPVAGFRIGASRTCSMCCVEVRLSDVVNLQLNLAATSFQCVNIIIFWVVVVGTLHNFYFVCWSS